MNDWHLLIYSAIFKPKLLQLFFFIIIFSGISQGFHSHLHWTSFGPQLNVTLFPAFLCGKKKSVDLARVAPSTSPNTSRTNHQGANEPSSPRISVQEACRTEGGWGVNRKREETKPPAVPWECDRRALLSGIFTGRHTVRRHTQVGSKS